LNLNKKQNYSARLPQFLKLATSKKQGNSIIQVDNIKTKQFCETSFNNGKLCRADSLVPMRFAFFPIHVSEVLRLPRKSDARLYKSAAPVPQNHPLKTENLMLQNATPLRKNQPGPPNISDEHTAPAMENASFQILFKSSTPAIVVGHARKPSRFARF